VRTTYIVGAGASKAIWGFPVMKGFLAECGDQLRAPDGNLLGEYLSRRFGDLAQLDLEDVLTDLDNSLSGLGGVWFRLSREEGLKTQQVYAQLLTVIRHRLAIPEQVPDATLAAYERVLGDFGEQDALITFNYDCGLETYARLSPENNQHRMRLKAMIFGSSQRFVADLHPYGPAFGEQPQRSYSHFLKLHGSLDYFSCSNVACPMRPAIHASGFMDGFAPPPDICPVCGADMETIIVPPTFMKSFDRYPKLCLLWRLALKVLRASERLVFWGFSCPASDHHVRWLLRSCRRGTSGATQAVKVTVIDPQWQSVECRLRSLLDPGDQIAWRSFETHESYEPF